MDKVVMNAMKKERVSDMERNSELFLWDVRTCLNLVKQLEWSDFSFIESCEDNSAFKKGAINYTILPVLACLLHAGFLLGLLFDLKIEALCSSETSVDFTALHDVISQKI
jgi:hypothetical protein